MALYGYFSYFNITFNFTWSLNTLLCYPVRMAAMSGTFALSTGSTEPLWLSTGSMQGDIYTEN